MQGEKPRRNGTGAVDPMKKKAGGIDEMEGLFVDPEPQSSRKSKPASGRASDRRRERGQAPQPAGAPDTRTSLPANDKNRAEARNEARSAMSELKGFAKATLTCTRGPEEGLSLNLIDGSYTVGRARENSFVLKDIAASRRHLRIDVEGGVARVIDLGSGNGTRVNGKRFGEHDLKHGDRIEIGASVLLYQEKGKASLDGNGSGVIDDAQERVIRAAEKLAAELSERMRFGEESQSGFEDGHVAKTRALPPAAKKELDAEVARAKAAQQAQQQQAQQPQKLWKETFTNLPLDRIIPAEEPLRGGPRAAESAPLPPPSSRRDLQPPVVASRQPLPRPQPLPMPPPPDEDYDVSVSTSRGSFMTSVLVTALVVVLGGGAVLGALLLTKHRNQQDQAQDAESSQKSFDDAMGKTQRALDQQDWATALQYATQASQLRPNDKDAVRYQREARRHIEELTKPQLAPSPPPPPAPTGPQATVTEIPPAQQAAPPAPTAAPAPAPAPRPAPVAARPRRESPPREAPPPPKPRPAKRGGSMSDEAAQAKFEDAVNALRDKDNKKGCRILEDIADKAPSDSRWKEKAENLFSRRCDA